MKEVVIFIPGIMGSVLKDGNEVIWPGGPLELIFPYKHMDSLRKVDLVASDIIRSVSVSEQYDDLIESLKECDFREGAGGNLRVLPYDWRKDNEIAAHALANLVDQFSADLGQDCAITLLAHSMGGLISRCYLESGKFTARPGFANVRTLITMGTPHRGAPMALSAALGKEKRVFLNKEQVQEIANNPAFPSLYQLLPPQGEPFAWDRNVLAKFSPVDIYHAEKASALGLSEENLAAAKRFHALLDLTKRPTYVRYFFFAGTRMKTASSAQIFERDQKLHADIIEHDDAGDGTVPFWSGSQSGIQTEPVGGEHGSIYKNGVLKFALGGLLGKPGVLASLTKMVELAVSPPVVNPEQKFQTRIDFPAGSTNVTGEVRLRRVVNAEGTVQAGNEFRQTIPVIYQGPEADHLTVLIDAPEYPGIYKVEFARGAGLEPEASATVFVQSETVN